MNLSDLQNPIANMPHIQQMRAGQEQAVQQAPVFTANRLEDEADEKLTTVQESEQDEQSDSIREEEKRGSDRRGRTRRRVPQKEQEAKEEPVRLSDGIHGIHLDLQA